MIQVGARIKRLRIEKGFNQVQLAEMVGVDSSLICKIESGRTRGSLSTLEKLAVAFGVSITELFDEPQAKAVGE